MVRQNIIVDKTFKFALQIVETYKTLVELKHEFVLSKQLLRSGTSIGANVNEATEAQSKADFISKMSIALKEARETSYWIKLLHESKYLQNDNNLLEDNIEIIRIITSIVKSTKANLH